MILYLQQKAKQKNSKFKTFLLWMKNVSIIHKVFLKYQYQFFLNWIGSRLVDLVCWFYSQRVLGRFCIMSGQLLVWICKTLTTNSNFLQVYFQITITIADGQVFVLSAADQLQRISTFILFFCFFHFLLW